MELLIQCEWEMLMSTPSLSGHKLWNRHSAPSRPADQISYYDLTKLAKRMTYSLLMNQDLRSPPSWIRMTWTRCFEFRASQVSKATLTILPVSPTLQEFGKNIAVRRRPKSQSRFSFWSAPVTMAVFAELHRDDFLPPS
jgi:hypothetical protein